MTEAQQADLVKAKELEIEECEGTLEMLQMELEEIWQELLEEEEEYE